MELSQLSCSGLACGTGSIMIDGCNLSTAGRNTFKASVLQIYILKFLKRLPGGAVGGVTSCVWPFAQASKRTSGWR